MNSIKHSSRRRSMYLIEIAFAAGSLALSPLAVAVCNEGCAGDGSTFLGDNTGYTPQGTAIGANVRAARKYNTANGANAAT